MGVGALAGEPPLASSPEPAPALRAPPEGFVDLRMVPGLHLSIGYHTPQNFTGAPLAGYGAPGAWLIADAAASLERVHRSLADEGLGLLVFDAYRPIRGTLSMVAWAERTGQIALIDDGYIARRSGHNRGDTIDLTLCDRASGEALDMGTPWDTFEDAAHTANATGEAAANRAKLVAALAAEGWWNYPKEWWHFTRAQDPVPVHRDVPYGCFEPDEGQWSPPEAWNEAGWQAPAWPEAVDCGLQ